MKITIVKQLDKMGCAVACLAMILGKTYSEVKKDFGNDFETEGLTMEQMEEYLTDFGLTVIMKRVNFWNDKEFIKKEIFKPFADAHIVRVKKNFDSSSGHVVVMNKVGKIFEPSGFSEERVKQSYLATHNLGVYKHR